jgi:hypothetical protein
MPPYLSMVAAFVRSIGMHTRKPAAARVLAKDRPCQDQDIFSIDVPAWQEADADTGRQIEGRCAGGRYSTLYWLVGSAASIDPEEGARPPARRRLLRKG